jgi:DNA helicase HerA-like ATPase
MAAEPAGGTVVAIGLTESPAPRSIARVIVPGLGMLGARPHRVLETSLLQNDSDPVDAAPAPEVELLGRVISVHGSQASVGIPAMSPQAPEEKRVTVGKFLGVVVGKSLLVGLITDVSLRANSAPHDDDAAVAQLDLIGEIRSDESGNAFFHRGVTAYPAMGDPVIFIGARELRLIFQKSGTRRVEVGRLHQDGALPAVIDVDEMLSKHFAVLGTTGVGKSSAITLLLHQILQARPDVRVLLLDVHNEYGRCFGERAQVLNPNNVKLPFWLFNFEEIVDVFFGGRPGLEEEVDFLSEVIPLAKSSYGQQIGLTSRLASKSGDGQGIRYTLDVPVPYRIADLLALLDTRMGKLENRASRMVYHKLMTRIETVCNDPRYAFMFENANVGGDTMADVLATLFRLPPNGKPMTVMQLAGFPSEVVDALVSVSCRMAFDLGLWSDGSAPLLVVCEEAHRYMAADHSVGFAPTRRSISRIAKEGRKYGVFLGLVTQRPAELDPTILSQCSTLFAMRMTNDRDQALLRAAVADTAANLLAFLPSLGTGEAFAFGEGAALPTRLKFRQLDSNLLPRSDTMSNDSDGAQAPLDNLSLAAVIERWRGRTSKQRANSADDQRPPNGPSPSLQPAPAPASAAQPGLDPNRFKLLKRPLEDPQFNAGAERPMVDISRR